ncbi:MAG: helix-turn-helix transcriptional regulator [Gammaproteobacteria bacterium]
MLLPLPDVVLALLNATVVGQVIMLATMLAADRKERRAHRWLILTLFSVALNSGGDIVELLRVQRSFQWLLPDFSIALFLVGPGLWLYCTVLTARDDSSYRIVPHFIPAMLLGAALTIEVAKLGPPEPAAQAQLSDLAPLILIALHLGTYVVLIVHRLQRTRHALKNERSALEGRTLNWLTLVAALFGFVLLTWVMSAAFNLPQADELTTLLMIAALVIIGLYGARQRNVFVRLTPADSSPVLRIDPTESEPDTSSGSDGVLGALNAPSTTEPTTVKYARSMLSKAAAEALRQRLEQVMLTDKPYLENDLALADLARYIQATPHQLSQLFSQYLQETFYDYVNRHRIEAVKATLARPQSDSRPLLEIALECGFGSKSAFNSTFRRLTGMSPGAYRRLSQQLSSD